MKSLWHIQSFFLADRYIHQTHEGARTENISKYVPPDALKLHPLALSLLRFLFKIFSKLLEKHCFLWMIF